MDGQVNVGHGSFSWTGCAAFLLLAVASCGGSPGNAPSQEDLIIGGTIDGRFPGVGYILADDHVVCSATLIEPDLVLTAGHCAGLTDHYRFGWGEVSAHTSAAVSSVAFHPRFREPGTDQGTDVQNFDIALMRLSEPAGVAPLSLAATPSSGAATALGYGSTSYTLGADGAYHEAGAGTDRKSTGETILSLDDGEVYAESAEGSSTCYGDSGSPLLVNGNVVGVLSRFVGSTRCLPEDHTEMAYTRTEGMESFFQKARACFDAPDVQSCLRQPSTHLCESPWLTNVASPGNVQITQGDAANGSSMFTVREHQEWAVRMPAASTRMHLFIFAADDARMTVKRVNGDTLGTAITETVYEAGAQYDVVVRSCNDTEQLITLVWSPEP